MDRCSVCGKEGLCGDELAAGEFTVCVTCAMKTLAARNQGMASSGNRVLTCAMCKTELIDGYKKCGGSSRRSRLRLPRTS